MTALDQNFSDLASILMQRRQMQNQQVQQDRANRLSDLQFKQLQREDDYQAGLQSAMANPQTTRQTSIAPQQAQAPQLSLASLGNQMQPQQFQPTPQAPASPTVQAYNEGRVSTQATAQTPGQAGAAYAMSQGRVDDAVKMFSLDDAAAQLQARGNLQDYYTAKKELEDGAKFFEVLKPYKGNPAGLQQVWPQIQRMFPDQSEGIDPTKIGADAKGMFAPLIVEGKEIPNRVVYHDDDGKTHIVDTTPKDQPETWGDPYQDNIGGKRALLQKSSRGQVRPVIQDNSTTVKVSTGVKGERDIPVAVQEKLQGKIELASDWGKLRDTFDPSFVPSTKFKTLAEFETNIQRVFSGNQPAIDWWMGYFDSRNLLMKDRSGAAVTEPEFRRFEQGAIRANDSPQTIINQLKRAAGKYEGHAEAFIGANERNHPQGVKTFTEGMGYQRKKAKGGKDPLGIL